MVEQNQNAFQDESHGDPASGSLAITPAGPASGTPDLDTEYDSATGTFVTRARAAACPTHTLEPVAFGRARAEGWTPARQRQFLEELADCGMIAEAAARVGMTRQSAWRLRRRAEGTAFGFAWEAALESGARRLHAVAFERAVEGVVKPVFYHGEKVGEQRVHDNRLLLALLARLPRGGSAARIPQVLDHWDRWLDAVEQGREEPAPALAEAGGRRSPAWRDEHGDWWTRFPPPDGFDGEEQGEWGEKDYRRALTAEEQESVDSLEAERLARASADRDSFFTRRE